MSPRGFISMLFCLAPGACLQPMSSTMDTTRTPADFACSVTVLGPGPGRAATPGLEPAWYMVEADMGLRARDGRREARTAVPPRVRVMESQRMDELWRLLADAGIIAAPPAGEMLGEE